MFRREPKMFVTPVADSWALASRRRTARGTGLRKFGHVPIAPEMDEGILHPNAAREASATSGLMASACS